MNSTPMPELVTVQQIAEAFRVAPATVRNRWVHRPDFPAPKYQPTRSRRLWAWRDVASWAQRGQR